MANVYYEGNKIRLSGHFTNKLTGLDIDPTSVSVTYKAPGTASVTYVFGVGAEVVKDSVGYYHADITVNTPGKWTYCWYSTGTGQALEETHLEVKQSILV